MKGCLTNITSAFVLFGIGYFLLSLIFPSLDWGRVDTSRAHLPERVLDPALHYDLIFETIEVDGIASEMLGIRNQVLQIYGWHITSVKRYTWAVADDPFCAFKEIPWESLPNLMSEHIPPIPPIPPGEIGVMFAPPSFDVNISSEYRVTAK